MSEGQGYGLFLAGAAAAALPADHPRRDEVVTLALEYFRGWEAMCVATVANSCQEIYLCGANQEFECLPSWKFNDDVSSELGTGSAPDGDEVCHARYNKSHEMHHVKIHRVNVNANANVRCVV